MSDELDEIQAIFFEECTEGLTTAEEGLSAMQAGDTSADVIAGVFRAVHSIKGGAGAFGHTDLTAFAHRFENVLDEVRAGKIVPTPGVTAVMLRAFDLLSDHVSAAMGQASRPDDAAMLVELDQVLENKGVAGEAVAPAPAAAPAPAPAPAPVAMEAPAAADADPFGFEPVAISLDDLDGAAAPDADEFGFTPVHVDIADLDAPAEAGGGPGDWIVTFGPSRAALANAGEPLLVVRELEELGGKVTAVDTDALPALRDLDPENAYFVWTLRLPGTVEESSINDCFDFVAPDSLVRVEREESAPVAEAAPAPETAAPALTLVDMPAAEGALPSPREMAREGDLDAMLGMVQAIAETNTVAPADKPKTPDRTEAVSQTIRVDLTKLDMLLNLVGELVIRNSILSDRLSAADQQKVELPELARLTRQIQDNVMSLRAQPIRQAFSRVPRMLRDLGTETGKQVVLETYGETTEVDKTVIEKIGDPLTHMIRNAVDHGLETPEERLAAGKPAEGTIKLSAEQKGARIYLRVEDDGRGINRERVRAKAVERGIIAEDANLTPEEIDQLICAPGFSTAEVISNISGRGVGMDVVRSNVEALGGRLEIASRPGKGTSFTMILPLTLAILDGMMVRIGGQRFVLPLGNVIETIQPEQGQVKHTTPETEVVDVRGQYIPIKRACDLFGLSNNGRRVEDSLVVIVESEALGQVGLMVDTIDDRREVVIKSLDQNLFPIRGLGGATILGDGSIALILDIEALATASPAHRNPVKGMAA